MQTSAADPFRPYYHVVPHFRRWAVRRLVDPASAETFRTQGEAINRAEELARRDDGEVLIHGGDGYLSPEDRRYS